MFPFGLGGSSIIDNTTTPFFPYKATSGAFENSPLQYDEANEKLISSVTIEVPPGTVQIGEGLSLSAAGVLPIFKSRLTGKKYLTQLSEFDGTGSQPPFWIEFEAEADLVLQPDYSTSTPLTGMFPAVATASELINCLFVRTNPGATLTGVRLEIVAQSTGEPIFYFPSKGDYLEGNGSDITADIDGFAGLDIGETPLALLVGEVLDINYAIDSGVLLGDGSIPYFKVCRQVGTFYDIITAKDITDTGSGEIITDAERAKLTSITGGRYLGVFADLATLETAHPTATTGDTATVTIPNGNMFYWKYPPGGWEDSGTGYVGDMLKSMYDPSAVNADAFSMGNMSETATEKILTDTERTTLSNQSGANSGDITLNTDDTTQQSLNLSGQELQVNIATETTDGAISAESQHKLNNITANGAGDGWISGLAVVENNPKAQTVLYGAGTYLINGIDKTIASSGTYDLKNAYGSVDHYSGMVDDEHAFVNIYVDNDEVIKSERGAVGAKGEIIFPPLVQTDTVCIAVIEIKVDKNDLPKDIDNKKIDDCRSSVSVNTDEFVSVSADDLGTGYLSDKLSNDGNITFTIINPGADETLKADYSGSAMPSMTRSTDANIDNLDVSSIAPVGILYTNMAGNRELRSLAGGTDGQIVILVNIIDSTIKVKHQSGAGQMIRTEGATDKTFGNYGGTRFVYHATTGYWYMSTSV